MKKLIYLASLLTTTSITLSQSPYKQTQLFFLGASERQLEQLQRNGVDPIFCIIVPSQTTALTPGTQKMYELFSESLEVPSSFFKEGVPLVNSKPVCLFFDWVDGNEGNTNLSNQAREKFIPALMRLKRDFGKNSRYIIISHGRGSLLLNTATRLNSCPKVDAIIELGTPIPATQKFYPNPSKFTQFFNIQTAMPYIFKHPTIHGADNDQKKYPPIKDFKPYNIRLIVNGKQISLQKDVFSAPAKKNGSLLGSTLLLLCQKASSQFSNYRSTWASIGTKQPQPVLMGLLKTQTSVQPTKQELARTAFNKQAYEQQPGRSLKKDLMAHAGTHYRNTYRTTAEKKVTAQEKVHNRTLYRTATTHLPRCHPEQSVGNHLMSVSKKSKKLAGQTA